MALAEMERQERILAGDNPAAVVAPWARPVQSPTLHAAIESFLFERKASQNPTSVRRMTKELATFATVVDKKYLTDITRADIFAYWNWLKDVRHSAPRTIYNRVQTILTFFKNRGITGLLATDEMREFDEKDVDYYTENNPDELHRFFELRSGAALGVHVLFVFGVQRTRGHVCVLGWYRFRSQTVTVAAKKDLDFRTKNGKTRVVPLPQLLIASGARARCRSENRRQRRVASIALRRGEILHWSRRWCRLLGG
jgi:hypothetical protein